MITTFEGETVGLYEADRGTLIAEIKRNRAENARLRKALDFIRKRAVCMNGSGNTCCLNHSGDPEEWCIACYIREFDESAIAAAREALKQK